MEIAGIQPLENSLEVMAMKKLGKYDRAVFVKKNGIKNFIPVIFAGKDQQYDQKEPDVGFQWSLGLI